VSAEATETKIESSGMRLRGNIPLPDNLWNIYDSKNSEEDYIKNFPRLVDPLIIGIFYGLYKSKELPPLVEVFDIKGKNWDSNVNIGAEANIFNNMLLCLWLKLNGMPDDVEDINEYRNNLYKFIKNILNVDYYKNVLIPFYLEKANNPEGEDPSYLYRINSSKEADLSPSRKNPEYIAIEFSSVQKDFMNEIIKPLIKT